MSEYYTLDGATPWKPRLPVKERRAEDKRRERAIVGHYLWCPQYATESAARVAAEIMTDDLGFKVHACPTLDI